MQFQIVQGAYFFELCAMGYPTLTGKIFRGLNTSSINTTKGSLKRDELETVFSRRSEDLLS